MGEGSNVDTRFLKKMMAGSYNDPYAYVRPDQVAGIQELIDVGHLTPEERLVRSCINDGIIDVDGISGATGLPSDRLLKAAYTLEQKGCPVPVTLKKELSLLQG